MSWHARLLDGIAPTLAGAQIVPLLDLRRALGERTLDVWLRLCARRDRFTGITHVSVEGLAQARWQKGARKYMPRSVQESLGRLRDAGLVIDQGRKWSRVRQGVVWAVRQVWYRQVLGALLARDSRGVDEAIVPYVTADWIRTAPGWGGARAGAGRRRKSPDAGNQVSVSENQVSVSGGEIKYVSRSIDPKKRDPKGTDVSAKQKQAADAAMDFASDERDPSGLVFGSVRREVSPAFGAVQGLPPYPGASIVRAATVPPPPRLHPDDGWERHLALLARAYEGACLHRWPVEQRARTRQRGAAKGQTYMIRPTGMLGHPTSAKWDAFRDVCREAADVLMALDVSPHAWASFSAQRWKGLQEHRDGERTGKVATWPPVAWLWSPKRLAEDGSSQAVAECAEGGRVVYGQIHKQLLARYAELHRAASLGTPSAQALADVMPLAEYDRLVLEARREAQEIQDDLRRRARAGEWLW